MEDTSQWSLHLLIVRIDQRNDRIPVFSETFRFPLLPPLSTFAYTFPTSVTSQQCDSPRPPFSLISLPDCSTPRGSSSDNCAAKRIWVDTVCAFVSTCALLMEMTMEKLLRSDRASADAAPSVSPPSLRSAGTKLTQI